MMRTETDKFKFDGDTFYFEPSVDDIEVCLNIEKFNGDGSYMYLSKAQTKRLANQLLEMCGEGE